MNVEENAFEKKRFVHTGVIVEPNLLNDIEVSIPKWEIVVPDGWLERKYASYCIRTISRTKHSIKTHTVFRRYSEFSLFNEHMTKAFPLISIPPFPTKTYSMTKTRFAHLDARRMSLEKWIKSVFDMFRRNSLVEKFFVDQTFQIDNIRFPMPQLHMSALNDEKQSEMEAATFGPCPYLERLFGKKGVESRVVLANKENLSLGELCPIFCGMLNGIEYTESCYEHLTMYSHGFREECRHGDICFSYVRCKQNREGVSDKCHMFLWDHPVRDWYAGLPKGFCPFRIGLESDPHVFLKSEKAEFQAGLDAALLRLCGSQINTPAMHTLGLIIEVIDNGFGLDLVLRSSHLSRKDRKSTHRALIDFAGDMKTQLHVMNFEEETSDQDLPPIQSSILTLMTIVQEKLEHPHLIHHPDDDSEQISCQLHEGHMLALLLYVWYPESCRADLLVSIQDGYANIKWPFFVLLLREGIRYLCEYDLAVRGEELATDVFVGVSNLLLPFDGGISVDMEMEGYFNMFVSASSSRYVAEGVRDAGDQRRGILIEFGKDFVVWMMRQYACCDVSWISKFPVEKELVFSNVFGLEHFCGLVLHLKEQVLVDARVEKQVIELRSFDVPSVVG